MKNPVWKQINKDLNNKGKFMDNWEQTEAACRKLLQLRMRLLPYLYAAYGDYRYAGVPPTRALVMDYPDDPATWAVDDQYMFGPSLDGRAAVHRPDEARPSICPKGDWYDFWTGRSTPAAATSTSRSRSTRFRSSSRAGPCCRWPSRSSTSTPTTRVRRTVRVYGPKPRPFVLYEDDGVTFDFREGRAEPHHAELGRIGGREKTGGYRGPSRYKIIEWTTK